MAAKTKSTDKKTEGKIAKAPAVFNLLASKSSHADSIQEALMGKARTARDVTSGIAVPSLSFQRFLHSRYLPRGRALELIGGDGVGKSTLVHTVLGWAAAQNMPGCHIETENKPVADDRIKRCYSTDRAIAQLIFDKAVSRFQAFEITEAHRVLLEWAKAIRDVKGGTGIPIEYPGVVVLDTFSKLMSPVEALSVTAYGKEERDKEEAKAAAKAAKGGRKPALPKEKELDEGSNFLHAKLAHKMTRTWPALLNLYNLFIIVVNHQNDDTKASMAGGGGFVMTAEQKDRTNRTTIGGKAFRQIVSYQAVIGSGKIDYQEVKGTKTAMSQQLTASMTKNSYGPRRRLDYRIDFFGKRDTDTHTTPVLDFDTGIADLLKQVGMKVIIHSQTEASCSELGLLNASPEEIAQRVHQDPDLMEELGRKLEIRGYTKAAATIPVHEPEPAQQAE